MSNITPLKNNIITNIYLTEQIAAYWAMLKNKYLYLNYPVTEVAVIENNTLYLKIENPKGETLKKLRVGSKKWDWKKATKPTHKGSENVCQLFVR